MSFLETKELRRHFGGIRAIDGVDLAFDKDEIHGVIGPNGAGKTTLFNLVTGFLPPTHGEIHFAGERIDGIPAHQIVRKGIARTFQVVRPFGDLSVRENVLVAWGFRFYEQAKAFLPYRGALDFAMDVLKTVHLDKRAHVEARTLPIGMLRRLEIARALALEPTLLLLDEPAAGLNEEESEDLQTIIRHVRDQGVTIALVEHRMSFVMGLCERITVLDQGRVISEGNPDEVRNDPAVIEAYLGE